MIHCKNGAVIPKPVRNGDDSSALDMCRVMSNYIRVGDEDEEGKTRPHTFLLSCLILFHVIFLIRFLTSQLLYNLMIVILHIGLVLQIYVS